MLTVIRYPRKILAEIINFRNLPACERPIFWRKMEALTFLALMPIFLMLGIFSRLLGKRRR